MELKLVFILFSVIMLVNADVQMNPEPTPAPTEKPSSTTLKPTTSTIPPVTSTEKPTTSTPQPTPAPTTSTTTTTTSSTTTTPKPTPTTTTTSTTTTTTTEKPTSTTAKPTTTTVGPTTTAAPPKPVPAPSPATYNITDLATNKTCIIVNMALQFRVTYQVANKKNHTALVNMPTNASINGSCGKDEQFINITWFSDPNNKTKDLENFILLNFNRNDTTKRFEINDFTSVIFRDKNFVALNISIQKIDLWYQKELFAAPLNMSYKCYKQETKQLSTTLPLVYGELIVSHLQLQAFHEKSGAVFDSAEDCEPADTPDIVPIAVGCALAGLVLIVLIAYLIGRRRSQARGYLSIPGN